MIDIQLYLQWVGKQIAESLAYIFSDDGRRYYGDLDGKL